MASCSKGDFNRHCIVSDIRCRNLLPITISLVFRGTVSQRLESTKPRRMFRVSPSTVESSRQYSSKFSCRTLPHHPQLVTLDNSSPMMYGYFKIGNVFCHIISNTSLFMCWLHVHSMSIRYPPLIWASYAVTHLECSSYCGAGVARPPVSPLDERITFEMVRSKTLRKS